MQRLQKKRGRHPKPSLKLAIDCGSLSTAAGIHSGVGTVTRNLIVELARLDKRNSYILYSFSTLPKELLALFEGKAKNRVLPRFGYKSVWLRLAFKWDRPHVFLATAQAVPKTSTPVIGFIYDLAYLKFPEFYHNYGRFKKNTEDLIKQAAHFVTISKSSEEAIVGTYLVPQSKISVFYPGVANDFNPEGSKYIDTCPYFLYVGALKKMKNIPQLLKAFYTFIQNSEKKYKLILLGDTQDVDPGITQTITSLKLDDVVILKSDVDSENLPKYYRGALAFVSIALWEGFGLPLIEAMSSGTPVIAASMGSQKEVVRNAGIVVDPTNKQEIVEALTLLATRVSQREKYIQKGLKRAEEFRWARFAKGVLSVVDTYCVQ